DRVVVTAWSGELASAPQRISLDQTLTHITLELEKGGRIEATVVDEQGDAVPDPTIELLAASGDMIISQKAHRGETVELGPVGPGEYKLSALSPGFTTATVPVTVAPGRVDVVVTLQKGVTIAGRVLDEYGRPASGVSVLIGPTGDSVLSDQQGAF